VTRIFDLVVIGSGAAGSAVARRCRAAGWTVAVVDKHPLGGTCALRGCDPKKVLVGAAAALDAAQALDGKGINPNGLAINWPDLIRFKRTFTDPVSPAAERLAAPRRYRNVSGGGAFHWTRSALGG
jgi:glutathione reductase (NADPH)